jgi:hypothetical protein
MTDYLPDILGILLFGKTVVVFLVWPASGEFKFVLVGIIVDKVIDKRRAIIRMNNGKRSLAVLMAVKVLALPLLITASASHQ